MQKIMKSHVKSKLIFIGSILGILGDKNFNHVSDEFKNKIEELIQKEKMLKDKNFDMADQIRQELNRPRQLK